MKYRFDDPELSRLFSEKSYKGRHSEAIVKAFRKRVQFIQAARLGTSGTSPR